MRTFSPSDAAFEGFRIIRESPGVLFAWALASFLSSLAILALLVVLVGPQWTDFTQVIEAFRNGQPQRAVELMQQFQSFSQLAQLVQYLVLILITCGVYRAALRPQEGGFGYLRIGMDEVRVGVLRFAFVFIWWIAIVVAVLVVLVLGLVAAALVGAGGHGGTAAGATPNAIVAWLFVAVLLICLLLVWPAVRLSLAEVITFAEKRFSFFDSWTMTRGLFWRMLGAYVLAWVLAVVVVIIALVMVAIVGLFTLAGVWPRIMAGETDFASMAPAFVPVGIVWLVVGTILGAVSRAIISAPGAYIYRALKGERAAAYEDQGGLNSPGMLVL